MVNECFSCKKTFTRQSNLMRHHNGRCLGRPPLLDIDVTKMSQEIIVDEITMTTTTTTTTLTNRKWTIISNNLKKTKQSNDMSLCEKISKDKKEEQEYIKKKEMNEKYDFINCEKEEENYKDKNDKDIDKLDKTKSLISHTKDELNDKTDELNNATNDLDMTKYAECDPLLLSLIVKLTKQIEDLQNKSIVQNKNITNTINNTIIINNVVFQSK